MKHISSTLSALGGILESAGFKLYSHVAACDNMVTEDEDDMTMMMIVLFLVDRSIDVIDSNKREVMTVLPMPPI
jgi:hypothetical protein